MKNIIFCDYDAGFSEEARANIHCRPGIAMSYLHCDIRETLGIPKCAIVSPANSRLSFSGGIDYIYGYKMFPLLQETADSIINKSPYLLHGKPMIPVGSAIIIPVHCVIDDDDYHLVAAPTMEYPRNIEGTKNAYWATLAALVAVNKFNLNVPADNQIETLIIPGMGTGCGALTFEESVLQINEAIDNFLAGNYFADEMPDDHTFYLANPTNSNLKKK